MRMFDVQGIEIEAPGKKVFECLRVRVIPLLRDRSSHEPPSS